MIILHPDCRCWAYKKSEIKRRLLDVKKMYDHTAIIHSVPVAEKYEQKVVSLVFLGRIQLFT